MIDDALPIVWKNRYVNRTPEGAESTASSAQPQAVETPDKAMPKGNAQVDESVQSDSVESQNGYGLSPSVYIHA